MANELQTVGTDNLPTAELNQSQEIQTVIEPKMQPQALTMWNDLETFKVAREMAKTLATSEIVPQNYRGKTADCMIAIDMANRMGVSPIVIMQNSQVVRGNFSWKGAACKAMIDSCGRYKKPSTYIEVGNRNDDSWGYYLEAEKKDGTIVKGPTVDIKMAKKEGWWSKKDKEGRETSKWQTMPELMLKYRASAFFFRTECASLAMGFLTAEENEDIARIDKQKRSASCYVQAPAISAQAGAASHCEDYEPLPFDEPHENYGAQDQDDGDELVCNDCGAKISDRVYDYSLNKFGIPLCFKCQKEHNRQ